MRRQIRCCQRLLSIRSRPRAVLVMCLVLILGAYYRFINYHLQKVPTGPEVTPESSFAVRNAIYRDVCWKIGKISRTQPMKIYYHLPKNISVCTVEKSGSTFWKRIFYFLYGVYDDKSIKSPWEISRYYMHHVAQTTSRVKRSVYTPETKAMFGNTTKVMFTRDPYTRLWSVYIDKFVLPDSWLDYGLGILSHRKKKDKKVQRNVTCADDVTFEEYIRFILVYARNGHWNPVHTVCNPCEFQPHYVGKMETFSRDANYILKKVKLDHLVKGHDSSTYAQDEVRMLTDYIFRLYKRRFDKMKECLSLSGLAGCLWRAFVLNGYIDPDWEFPQKEFSDQLDNQPDIMIAKAVATDLLLRAVSSSRKLTSKQLKAYRRDVMAKNFRALPPDLLEEVLFAYSVDFTLFGYNPRPVDIFPDQSFG